MSKNLILLFVLLLFFKHEAESAIAVRKFVYQKDMSEYCRRRVMPSVFLGRQVIDAYSQILHFSRLELPYSCFVSIRTESGSNIILVIQLMSDKSLIESCRESKNQLLVYEIGETFGGYWGALPDNVMRPEPPDNDHLYTLKTTHATTTNTIEETTTERTTKRTTTKKSEEDLQESSDKQGYFTVEVPIVNVSAKLVPGNLPSDTIFDPEDAFDLVFNMSPGPGLSYQTKMLPLVQFSMEDENSALRTDGQDFTPKYQVDFNADIFTPDSRITLPPLGQTTKKKQRGKYKYNANRRLNFKKNKQLLAEKGTLFYRKLSISPRSPLSNIFTKPYDFMQPLPQTETELASNSWEVVDAILKNLSKTNDKIQNTKVDEDVANLLHGLAKIGYNESVYLLPNSSWYTRHQSKPRPTTTKYRTDSITWRQPSASYRINYLDEVEDTSKVEGLPHDANKLLNTSKAMTGNDSVTNDRRRSGDLLPLALDVDGIVLNVTQQKTNEIKLNNMMNNPYMSASEISETSTTTATPGVFKPLTLVDHESWENMVHAASLMAVMLNQSVTQPNAEDGKQGPNVTQAKPINVKRRKKRYIHAIPIEHAKPHHLPVTIELPTSAIHTNKISDAQEFQRLIELQDDEIHDRVALRYLRQYVGPALFNICDFNEPATRHVYLFNSSRLVLAITNFTLERMTVVMTPARTLLTSDARCASAHLECQVSGARVCIDSLSACDGVPNCGSYDIYDEDRLTCGGSAGLQHNVCLAAITFLAVLLTILYTVHYWLKRCVPRVSDAFFIYTDAAENVLYLDTIMRSPYDTGDGKDFYRGGPIPDYMECNDMGIKTNSVGSAFTKLIKFFGCKRQKRMSSVLHDQIIEDEFDDMHLDEARLYSFAEVELNKMGSAFVSDAAVQTGSSLEMKGSEVFAKRSVERITEQITEYDSEIDDIVAHYEGKRRSTGSSTLINLEMLSNQPSDELSILKFVRKARSISMQMSLNEEELEDKVNVRSKLKPHFEEKEIQCLEYDPGDVHEKKAVSDNLKAITAKVSDEKSKPSLVKKKIRFEEETRTMQAEKEEEDIDEQDIAPEKHRRSKVYGGGKNIHSDDADSNTDADEPRGGPNREFKSYFWGGGKNKPKKPSKKKTQISLR